MISICGVMIAEPGPGRCGRIRELEKLGNLLQYHLISPQKNLWKNS
jgi:hypothetical protein